MGRGLCAIAGASEEVLSQRPVYRNKWIILLAIHLWARTAAGRGQPTAVYDQFVLLENNNEAKTNCINRGLRGHIVCPFSYWVSWDVFGNEQQQHCHVLGFLSPGAINPWQYILFRNQLRCNFHKASCRSFVRFKSLPFYGLVYITKVTINTACRGARQHNDNHHPFSRRCLFAFFVPHCCWLVF